MASAGRRRDEGSDNSDDELTPLANDIYGGSSGIVRAGGHSAPVHAHAHRTARARSAQRAVTSPARPAFSAARHRSDSDAAAARAAPSGTRSNAKADCSTPLSIVSRSAAGPPRAPTRPSA
ncbi:hypothetical protein EVAR_35644_1 [Eumeta japonica]|uniref:Uncharacterized protein n=1 Tax=Eumeta variegata TaxID=151549 RepID=A0A4C1WEW0_EUMVA|nr:hypothetical protein EVAR_35644_1 [Eumeta japonica]